MVGAIQINPFLGYQPWAARRWDCLTGDTYVRNTVRVKLPGVGFHWDQTLLSWGRGLGEWRGAVGRDRGGSRNRRSR